MKFSIFGFSYHMARNALLELIQSLRADVGSVSTETIREFLVGYAAAVVLIDAARFLRDLFGPDEIVRRKLNESFDLYGIAAGSFDSIPDVVDESTKRAANTRSQQVL